MHYGHPKDEGLAANINDSMDAGGMAAASVQGAVRQLTRGQHGESRAEVCGREGNCGGGPEEQAQEPTTSDMDRCRERVDWAQRGRRRMA